MAHGENVERSGLKNREMGELGSSCRFISNTSRAISHKTYSRWKWKKSCSQEDCWGSRALAGHEPNTIENGKDDSNGYDFHPYARRHKNWLYECAMLLMILKSLSCRFHTWKTMVHLSQNLSLLHKSNIKESQGWYFLGNSSSNCL